MKQAELSKIIDTDCDIKLTIPAFGKPQST